MRTKRYWITFLLYELRAYITVLQTHILHFFSEMPISSEPFFRL